MYETELMVTNGVCRGKADRVQFGTQRDMEFAHFEPSAIPWEDV